ncbi:PQQ-dependent sugar dehydrogenase [Aestuariivivens sediminis]|uniref:PQQ-dependent sugar dehydrogenase n=1 Tax=Aestuariivivens sediminis TaxID=2913557 RepID=UPI001F5845D1|nr:PQQ-dependent sugar dehydrogenase [Aestuariivivens sediminis]
MNDQLKSLLFAIVIVISSIQCSQKSKIILPPGDSDNGGLFIPDHFEALVVTDSIEGKARHLAVNNFGAIFVNLRYSKNGETIAILKDTTHNGKANLIELHGNIKKQESGSRGSYSTAMKIHNGYLYFSTELVVYRHKLDEHGEIVPGEPEVIMTDDHPHRQHQHIGKPIAFDNKGYMYVPFGGPSNACQVEGRTPGSPGMDPCPQLEDHGGIWRFDANKTNQTQKDGYKFATGIRSVVGLDWNPVDETLYAVVHGRDDLFRLFPEKYTPWQSAMLPSEEFIRVTEGSDFGWPYCYYDQIQNKKVLAPEYGGDGKIIGRCESFDDPVIGFPGHWAPNDLMFYQGDQLPEYYKNGAFIAFHGSTNRAPYPQAGYFVGFVPFKNGKATGEWEVFADGFAQIDPIISVYRAVNRPMGLSTGPDGSIYISDSNQGKVWRVMYKGDKNNFGENERANMGLRKLANHIKTPDEENDNLMKDENLSEGHTLYFRYCSACHQDDGHGAGGRFPPLVNTDWVTGDKTRLINIVLKGLEGTIEVNGLSFSGLMPQHSFLKDDEIATILTYIRTNFGNEASAIEIHEVSKVRKMLNQDKAHKH